ncbi:MAG: hypothetical protein U5R31_07740 [Acidimicrobiia bacterium]|nr:hypothetical protein [Acidimicrobiia bacterium]
MSNHGTAALDEARSAFHRDDWPTAFTAFRRAASESDGLTPDDAYALAESAWWIGEIDAALAAWEDAHSGYMADERAADAAMSAMFVAAHSMERGETAAGSAWMGRANRLLAEIPEGASTATRSTSSCSRQWAAETWRGRSRSPAHPGSRDAASTTPTCAALGLIGEGRVLLKQGQVDAGVGLLDEAMLGALSERLHPVWTGATYCHLMDACHELSDVRRAKEWTDAAAQWCDQIPDAALYRGICRVHRAQVLQVQGSWEQAEREASRACADVAHLHVGTVAEGHYEIGEIRRLRGDLAGAEEAYKRAHGLGRDPQPGLALTRLEQGRERSSGEVDRDRASDASHRSARARRASRRPGRDLPRVRPRRHGPGRER